MTATVRLVVVQKAADANTVGRVNAVVAIGGDKAVHDTVHDVAKRLSGNPARHHPDG